MKSLDGRNNVKIYNLSAGKSLPDWLNERKRRKLVKRDVDIQRRIDLIQDFKMPDVSECIRVTPDGQYVLSTGTYKPRVKCYEVSALSLKFERCFDAEIIDFLVLSEDYSKIVFLQEDRYIEFHNQGGRWYRTRIPKFGRDIAYHYPSCDLYIGTSGSEIYRLNLHEGKFLNSLQIDSPSVNKCVFNPVHYLFTCGTEDGRVEAWDPRSRHRVGVLDCAMHMIQETKSVPAYKSAKEFGVTSLAYFDSLILGVGTQTGQILMFDIRNYKPILVKDHMDGFPIIDIEFQNKFSKAFSLSCNALKIWDKDSGEPYTSIESDVKFNDLCTVPNSGMIFLAAEDPKMQIYFLPSLGPAPKWCGHLDSLVEELEEEETPPAYDDYKFITEHELHILGLDTLIGTNILRAVMHGYYIDVRLYNKAKRAISSMDKEHLTNEKIKQKIIQDKEMKSERLKNKMNSLPKVNQEPFMILQEEMTTGSKDKAAIAKEVLEDSRFGAMFSKPEFGFNKEAEVYNLIQPLSGKSSRFRQMGGDSDDEDEQRQVSKVEDQRARESDSDSDSIMSSLEGDSGNEEEDSVEEHETRKDNSRKSKKGKSVKTTNERAESESERRPNKVQKDKPTQFISADSMEELKNDYREKKKLPLVDRLREEEENEGEVIGNTAFGSREMKFKIESSSKNKFERLRQQQKEHHLERKELSRSTKNIRGKLRMKKPFM